MGMALDDTWLLQYACSHSPHLVLQSPAHSLTFLPLNFLVLPVPATRSMDLDLTKLKWEKRKKGGLAPSLRSGTSMTYWSAKGLGVLFGGVLDHENDEDLSSVFYNDL